MLVSKGNDACKYRQRYLGAETTALVTGHVTCGPRQRYLHSEIVVLAKDYSTREQSRDKPLVGKDNATCEQTQRYL